MRRTLRRIWYRFAVAHPVRGVEAEDRILLLRARRLARDEQRDGYRKDDSNAHSRILPGFG